VRCAVEQAPVTGAKHPVDYHRPRSLAEAWELHQATPGAWYVAGGTDVMVRLRQRSLRPAALISLAGIPELGGIEDGERIHIGALCPVSDVIVHPAIGAGFPVLCEAGRALGSQQIRNRATIGGNLCHASPCADTALPLLVLGARLSLWSPVGRRELPIDEFFVGPGQTDRRPGEILTAIVLDQPRAGTKACFLKKGRVRMDLSLASLAMLLEMDGPTCLRARLAAGSVAPLPLRLRRAEALLEGQALTPERIAEARAVSEADVSPITDLRTSADYRRRMVGVFVKRAAERLLGWSHS
jgi:CO/xanthine dehydrogenase FAD-binding subunit